MILTIDVVVGLQALYFWQLDRVEVSEQADQPSAKLEAVLDAQRKQLTDYRIVDAKKGIVAIPIDRAMEPGRWPNFRGTAHCVRNQRESRNEPMTYRIVGELSPPRSSSSSFWLFRPLGPSARSRCRRNSRASA